MTVVIGVFLLTGGVIMLVVPRARQAAIQRNVINNEESDWKPSSGEGTASVLATV